MDKPINQIIGMKSYEQLKAYLEERPNLNLAIMLDNNGTNLLHFAAFKNDLSKMKSFIRHYKQFTLMNHGTGMYTGESTFTGKLKAWINSANNQGYLPIHYAALHGNLEMIKFLEEGGSNMHYKTSKDQNILFMAAQYNQLKTLVYLFQSNHNFDVNTVNCRQQTILHVAAIKGYVEMITYLLTIGADIEAIDCQQCTPLILATKQGKKQAIKILLIKGASRLARNSQNKTSLQIAYETNKDEIATILDDNYSTTEKIKIKCNKKIVYEPEKPTYTYSLFFIFIFHLFFLPVNVLTQFKIQPKYIKIVPFIFEGIYETLVFAFYFMLLKKFRRREPKNLMDLTLPFCADCKRKLNERAFHCHICARCVYRYDHHCPWINNCVGSHNVGKFTFFLFLLAVGLIQVIFCSICMLFPNQSYVKYRDSINVSSGLHWLINIATIIFGLFLVLGILNLLKDQIHNLVTNTTSLQRAKNAKKSAKQSTILTDSHLNESLNTDEDMLEQEQNPNSCFRNIIDMLTGPS